MFKEIRTVVGDGPTYVSFDVDGLDPAVAPGTGTPEIGGLNTFEGQQIIRSLRGLNLVGGDIVEVSPPFDPTRNTALLGATRDMGRLVLRGLLPSVTALQSSACGMPDGSGFYWYSLLEPKKSR